MNFSKVSLQYLVFAITLSSVSAQVAQQYPVYASEPGYYQGDASGHMGIEGFSPSAPGGYMVDPQSAPAAYAPGADPYATHSGYEVQAPQDGYAPEADNMYSNSIEIPVDAFDDQSQRKVAFGHKGEIVGCPTGYLVGSCSSAGSSNCPLDAQTSVSQAALCAAFTPSAKRLPRQELEGAVLASHRGMAVCPPNQVAYLSCASNAHGACVVHGQNNLHAIWCRDIPEDLVFGDKTEDLCGGSGHALACQPGYGIVESCASGLVPGCDFGVCAHTNAFSQIKCRQLIPKLNLMQQQVYPEMPETSKGDEYREDGDAHPIVIDDDMPPTDISHVLNLQDDAPYGHHACRRRRRLRARK